MGVETVSSIIAAFVSGSLGIAALMRNFRSRLCVSFAALTGLLFAHETLALLESFDSAERLSSPRVHIVVALLLGPLALWFLGEVIPAFRKNLHRLIGLGLSLALVMGLMTLTHFYSRVATLTFVVVHVGFVLPALVWVYCLKKGEESISLTRERLRFRYAFWGAVVTIAFFITNALHFAGWHVPPLGTLARVFYLIFIFQTFIQKELMTSEEVVAKVALFGGIAFMLSIIFSLLVSWVGDQRGLFFFNTLIASFVIIILFDPIRKLSTRLTRKLFLHRNAVLEDELNALSVNLMGSVEPADLARRIAGALRRSLGTGASALFLVERDGLSYLRVGETTAFLPELSASHPLVEYMTLRRGRPFILETIENDRESFHSAQARKFCEACIDMMRKLGADFVIPFVHESRLVGFCTVSTCERIVLSNEQLRLFIPIARQIAFLLRNAQTFNSLRDRDKLAAVGEMAAGLAHEIKNPLGAIKGAAELLQGELRSPDANTSEFLKIILDESVRLSEVLTDFLDYAKPRRNYPQTSCDPLRVVEHTAALCFRDGKTRCEIESEKEGLTLEADPEILKQVLLNLFINASQAMEGATASPWIKVRIREIRPRRLLSFVESLPLYKVWEGWEALTESHQRPFIEIEVQDNGPGIGPEDLGRIFLPFFTTKPKGTGLGLAICQRLVEGMGGSISVKQNSPSGAVFTLHLPLKREEGKDSSEHAWGKLKAKEVTL